MLLLNETTERSNKAQNVEKRSYFYIKWLKTFQKKQVLY
jgi:hypothetical protein